MAITERQIKKIYSLLDPEIKISNGYQTKQVFDQFINMFKSKYGVNCEERLVDFCIFAAKYYSNIATRNIKQVFSKGTITRFEKSNSTSRYIEDRWLAVRSKELTRQALVNMMIPQKHPQSKYLYMPSEENTKSRFLNQPIGFALCQTSTLGWSPLSPSCCVCEFTSNCKLYTSRKYPEIYRLRKEYYEREKNKRSN